MEEAKTPRKIHRNPPQLMMDLIQPHIGVALWGRGTGKTQGPLADFMRRNATMMPRGLTACYMNTYTGILEKVLPGLYAGWELYGMHEEVHFYTGRFAPKKANFPKPYLSPRHAKHMIHMWNGHGIMLVSGDRSMSNGFSFDAAGIDEARKQDSPRLNQFLPTIRGSVPNSAPPWANLSCYLSLLFTSDMPQVSSQAWLLAYKEQQDDERVQLILQVQRRLFDIGQALQAGPNKTTTARLERERNKLANYLNELRKDLVYVSEASTLDNVHALGLQPIKDFKRTLTEVDYETSVLNLALVGVESGFYAGLDEETHGYTAENYGYIDQLEIERNPGQPNERNCRWDEDIELHQPLDIAMDYNAAINCIATGQLVGASYQLLSTRWVKSPKYLKDAVAEWCYYYRYHARKEVNYYYDQTAVADDASGRVNYAEQVRSVLVEKGWKVNMRRQRKASHHHTRYLLWADLFSGSNPKLPRFRFNKKNCEQWYKCAKATPTRSRGATFVKDKSSERPSSGVAPEDATHLTEAVDGLIYPRLSSYMSSQRHHYSAPVTL